ANRSPLNSVVTWFPARNVPFLRITCTSAAAPWTVPADMVSLVVDYAHDDGVKSIESDDVLIQRCLQDLGDCLHAKFDLIAGKVNHIRFAYPVFDIENEPLFERIQSALPFGMKSVGRNGEFEHILMEDVMLRTHRLVDQLLGE